MRTAARLPSDIPHRPSTSGSWESVRTWANLVTGARTAVAVTLGVASIVERSTTLVLVAYAVYWVGDVLDGAVARALDQETRIGAVLDIVTDRACSAVLVCALAVLQPQLWPALAVFLLQFMALDCALSLSFLRWPLLSPNYFYVVDRTIWRWNWSPPAKMTNTAGVVLAVGTGVLWVALAVAMAQLVLKVWTARMVLRLEVPPEPGSGALPAR